MDKRHFAVLGLVLSLVLMTAGSARANVLTSATATADCSGYILTVTATSLAVGTPYTIDFTFALTPTSGPPITVNGSIDFTATSSTEIVTDTASWPSAPLSVNYTVTGSATITSSGSTLTITFNGSPSLVLSCAGTACPATIGFWKHHPFPSSVQISGLTIAGVTYSAADLLTILNAQPKGNAVIILGKQLVGALLNLAAGGVHNATADAAIADAETLLVNNSLNLLTSVVPSSSTLGGQLLADETTLDSYNGANFNTCSEGSGLMLGSN
jgi:hypothetical protein